MERLYPFPSRTRKSSSLTPMILLKRESRLLPGFFYVLRRTQCALGHKIQSKESYQVCLPYLQDQQPSLANLVSTRLACVGCCRALARVRMLYALGHKIQSKESYQVCLPLLTKCNSLFLQTWLVSWLLKTSVF